MPTNYLLFLPAKRASSSHTRSITLNSHSLAHTHTHTQLWGRDERDKPQWGNKPQCFSLCSQTLMLESFTRKCNAKMQWNCKTIQIKQHSILVCLLYTSICLLHLGIVSRHFRKSAEDCLQPQNVHLKTKKIKSHFRIVRHIRRTSCRCISMHYYFR